MVALAARWWISWSTVVAFAAISVYGLAHISSIEWLLVGALPLTFVSLLIATAHTATWVVNRRVRIAERAVDEQPGAR